MILPSCYYQYKSMANANTYLFQEESSVYGQEFAGFCEDYAGFVPIALSQWIVSLESCHIRIRMDKYSYTRSKSFLYNCSRDKRYIIYKNFIDSKLIRIWKTKGFDKDRFSQ